MRFYTTLDLGPNRSLTPEGFTLFKDVSISRIGEMIYGPGETEIAPGADGLIHIDRKPEEVFSPETLDSCNGKALVINHPDEDVKPHNWQYLANGVMFGARRGSGAQKDETVADVLVCTNQALAEIDSGKREVSLGYDADYFQTGEGRGEQRNIIVNHVALVEAGRCGSRCAIRDHKHKGACHMSKSLRQRILDAINGKDESGLKKLAEEIPEEPSNATHIHVHTAEKAKDEEEDPTEKRFKKIEDCLEKLSKDKAKDESEEEKAEREKKEKAEREKKEKEAKDKAHDAEKEEEEKERKKAEDAESEEMGEEVEDEEKEEAKKAKDSSYLAKAFDDVKMKAEIIAPGVRLPTFDKASDPKKTFRDCICGLRRKSLQLGTSDGVTAGFIDQVRGRATDGAEFLKMPCKDVRTIFNSVAALKKAHNNGEATRDRTTAVRDEKELTPTQQFTAASNKRWGIGQK